MYNAELKQRFISEQMGATPWKIKTCELMFNAFEPYEEKWGADLCTRTAAELQPAVNQMMGFRARSKWAKLTLLKDYVRWCIEMRVEGACDEALKITTTGLDKVKERTIANPKHLESFLNVICEPAEKQATDSIYRCYYWLAYAGMDEDDILDAKCEDVDFRKLIINYPKKNTVLPLYPEALTAMQNCVELEDFLYVHPNYDSTLRKRRVPGDTIVRGVKATPTLKTIKVELSRRARVNVDETHLRLSYFRVWLSGIFYRMYEQEIMGIPPDFNAIVAEQMEGKNYKLDSGRNTIEAKHRQLVRDYEEDYERWKLAWYM